MKVIIYFLLLQVVIFSEAKKLREITYYEYYPVITEKIETGMEIQVPLHKEVGDIVTLNTLTGGIN